MIVHQGLVRYVSMELLIFKASWCQPCKALWALISRLQKDGSLTVTVIPVDIDEERSHAKSYDVKSVPTLILLDETGEEVKRTTGNKSKKDLLEFVSML